MATDLLFTPLTVGELELPNRVVMAPLTRTRASEGRTPNALMAEYYAQRASAGLILSEATSVDPMGVGYPDTPGLWSDEQTRAWEQVTRAVHDKGGRIFAQLWHVGRISDPHYLGGELPVAPSAIAAVGHPSLLRPQRPFVTPRALALDEIPRVVDAYRAASANAKRAGFDGVELHGANGYLLDQFLQDASNKRDDAYGGSAAGRARLLLEATDAAASVFGAGRVGVHLAPRGDFHSVGDSDKLGTFSYVARELGRRHVAFICTREHRAGDSISAVLRKEFGGPLVANEGYTREAAEQAIAAGEADAVAWGKDYIANPDLPERFKARAQLNKFDPSTFYGQGPKGYTDYPTLQL